MDRVDTLIDHAADLQQQINRLSRELLLVAVAAAALGAGMMIMGVRAWLDER